MVAAYMSYVTAQWVKHIPTALVYFFIQLEGLQTLLSCSSGAPLTSRQQVTLVRKGFSTLTTIHHHVYSQYCSRLKRGRA